LVESLAAKGVIRCPQIEEVRNRLGQTVVEYRIEKRTEHPPHGGLGCATIVLRDLGHFFFGFADGAFLAWLKSDPAPTFGRECFSCSATACLPMTRLSFR
jgi:hypothetical protein